MSNPTPPTQIEDRAPGPSKPGAKGLLVVVVAFVVVVIAVVIVVARTYGSPQDGVTHKVRSHFGSSLLRYAFELGSSMWR